MAKFKDTPRGKQAPAVKSTKTSIVKKRRTKKNSKLLSSIHKNNLKKLSTSNEITKNTHPNIQSIKKKKQRTKNKLGAKDTKKLDVPTRYRKDDKKNSEVFQKAQINTSSKTKQKIKNKNRLDVKNTNSKTKQKIKNKNRLDAKDTSSKTKQKMKNKNRLDVKDTEKPDVPTRYRKDDKKNSEVFREAQINTNSKTKQKIKNKNRLDAKDTNSETKQKMKNTNRLDVKDTKRSDVPTKYSKDNKRTSEVLQKAIHTDNKIKRKKRNRKRKQNMNLNHPNNDAVTINDTKEKNKKLQMPTKNLDLEHRKTKIEKLKKINEKKIKRISVEAQQIKSDNISKLNKHKTNIKQLEKMLPSKSQLKSKVQPTLRDRMMTQLRASRFRFINEILYNNNSSQSKHYFKTEPDAFMAYHAGYKQQLEQWPVNPLDVIISSIKKLPKDNVIADFGCGEARLAASVPHTVHSFDFIALNDKVKACDMAHTPLLMNSVHVVVFCLSLMGSNLNDYITEANRILKNNGILKIAEVASRFEDVKDFIKLLRSYGFKNTWEDLSHNLFYFMDFKKEEDISMKRKNLPSITLKSCLYKKR